ncbi:MAG: alkaline phosphatase family protein [Pirellulales bacterium]
MTLSFRSVVALHLLTLAATWFGPIVASAQNAPAQNAPATDDASEPVGYRGANRIVTPVNQILTPAGRQIDLPGMRPQTLALSPDGKVLVTAGKTNELVVVDPISGEIIDRVGLPSDRQKVPPTPEASTNILLPDKDDQVSFTGLVFSPSGDRIYLSNVEGSIKVFAVSAEGKVTASHSFSLPPANAPRRAAEIPSGLAVAPDGSRLYVCGNLSNQLLEIDTQSGQVVRSIAVGALPYDVVLVGKRAVVSNWGGRRPEPGVLTGPAGRGTEVRIDPVHHAASEGSVSIIDLESGQVTAELLTGLHASGLAVSPDQRYVLCANAASDTVSVVDVERQAVVATIWARSKPSDLLGASPNAVTFAPDGHRFYVANGTQNAIGVCQFDPADPPKSRLLGLIPVGWFPGALVLDRERQQLLVANIKGLPKEPKPDKESGGEGFNSHQYFGSLSMVPVPTDAQLAVYSRQAALNLRQPRILQTMLPPRENQPARAIPERIGEPSLIRHVVYIIKENRTYDQVFGSLEQGNGDASLCIFGSTVTPNQHKLAQEFGLLDNLYCCGILSADGHEWTMTGFSTDYMEKSFAGFPRSYPDGMGEDENDAMAYSPAGFLWDNVLAAKKSVRNYGEFMAPAVKWADAERAGEPGFLDCYRAWKDKTGEVVFESWPSLENMRVFSPTDFVGWNMSVPDQWRADYVLKELKAYEAKGDYPSLTVICLPQDHTSGTSAKCPTPAACVADNDLALGRIVEGLSHSKFWPQMAIFVIEDDPQAGWDHVSGYRTIGFAISPYSKRRAVVSTQYNTTSMLRTMEQILGLRPMNQFDASALPMFDCFVDQPDLTPYTAVANQVPLDQMNPDPQSIQDPQLRADALVSSQLNFREVDRAPEDVLNQILWRSIRGTQAPYPAWAIDPYAEEDEEEEEEEEREEAEEHDEDDEDEDEKEAEAEAAPAR